MNVTPLIVGIDGWEEYTAPLLESIFEHEPDCDVVVIDNDSSPPYPPLPYVVRTERTCYSAAINRAALEAPAADWLLVMNNDVLCDGPFIEQVAALDDNALYGMTLRRARGVRYIDAWFVAIPRRIWDDVGEWDEGYVFASWDDIDYSYRARQAGYRLREVDLPFTHLETRQRVSLPGFKGTHKRNERYFMEKHGL